MRVRFGKARSAGLARRRVSEYRVQVRIAKHWAIQQAKDGGYPEGMEVVAGDSRSPDGLASPTKMKTFWVII